MKSEFLKPASTGSSITPINYFALSLYRSKMDSETEHCINRFLADLITNTLMPNTIAKHSKPLIPASTSVKSMRHRIQVHLEIISSIKRMIFGVSMKNSPSHSGCIAAKNCFQVLLMYKYLK